MNRCAARGGGRWTRAGEAFCQRHQVDAAGIADQPEPGRMSHDEFRARLLAGDYDALVGPGVREALQQAAAEAGLETEIGVLRVALTRLLQEERDPSRLATGVARVAGVAVQAARLRHGAQSEPGELRATLENGLTELDDEREERRDATNGGEHG